MAKKRPARDESGAGLCCLSGGFYRRIGEVEAVKVHDLGPCGYEVFNEGLFGIGGGVDFGDGTELGVGAEDEVGAGCGVFDFAGGAIDAFEDAFRGRRCLPFSGHVEQIDEEVIGEGAGFFR